MDNDLVAVEKGGIHCCLDGWILWCRHVETLWLSELDSNELIGIHCYSIVGVPRCVIIGSTPPLDLVTGIGYCLQVHYRTGVDQPCVGVPHLEGVVACGRRFESAALTVHHGNGQPILDRRCTCVVVITHINGIRVSNVVGARCQVSSNKR